MGRRILAGVVLVAVLWPTAGRAEGEPPATTVPPEVVELDEAVPEAVRTMTATPRTGLVHDQVVDVAGQGFPAQRWIGLLQCIVGGTSIRDCGPVRFLRTGGNGRFHRDFPVQAVFDTRRQDSVDCRVTPCLLATTGWPTQPGARTVELEFDPGGPDPVRHTAAVTPDTGLVDEQVVTITSDDFIDAAEAFDHLHVSLCLLPVDSLDDCDPTTAHNEIPEDDGSFEEELTAYARIRTRDGRDHDCRTGGCAVLVKPLDDVLSEAAIVPVAYDPGAPLAPEPSVHLQPGDGFRDGQIVDLRSTGWDTRTFVDAALCPSDATNWRHCDRWFQPFEFTGSTHAVRMRFGLPALLQTNRGPVDCRSTPCSIFLFPDELTFPRGVEVPMDFEPDAPLFTPTIRAITPRVHGGDRVQVTGTGRPDAESTLIQCAMDARGAGGCARGTAKELDLLADPHLWESGSEGGSRSTGRAFSAGFRVRRHLHLSDGRQVDCTRTACAIVLVEDLDRFDRSDRAILRFAP